MRNTDHHYEEDKEYGLKCLLKQLWKRIFKSSKEFFPSEGYFLQKRGVQGFSIRSHVVRDSLIYVRVSLVIS